MQEKNDNCLSRIRNQYSDLNKAEKKVARYILNHPRQAIHFTISKLAEETDSSVATVFRLCNKLGYGGFQAFKIHLAASITTPMENIHEDAVLGDDPYIVMHKLSAGYRQSLERTIGTNPQSTLLSVADLLKKSRQVYLFAMGGSFPYAEDARHKWVRNGLQLQSCNDSHWQSMSIALSQENDCFVFFTSSGLNKDLYDRIVDAKKMGRSCILFTSDPQSPLSEYADHVLITYGSEYQLRSEALESRVCTLLLIDTIYILMAVSNETAQEETLDRIYKIRESISKHRM